MGTKYALEIPTFLQPLFKPPLAETTLASVDEARVGGWTLQDPRVAEEVPRDRADEEVYRTYVDTRRALVMRGDYRVK